MSECVYLLQEREFIKTKENIYKIGRSSRLIKERLKGYPKNSKLIFHKEVLNSRNIEKKIKTQFCEEFKQRKDIGSEYFEGDIIQMIKLYKKITQDKEIKKDTEINDIIFLKIFSQNICELLENIQSFSIKIKIKKENPELQYFKKTIQELC